MTPTLTEYHAQTTFVSTLTGGVARYLCGASWRTSTRVGSCLRCRKRRTFCSKDKPSCETCIKLNKECVYAIGRKIQVNESLLRELQAKVKYYENAFSQSVSSTHFLHMSKHGSDMEENDQGDDGEGHGDGDDEGDELEDSHPLIEHFNELSVCQPGSFKGPGSSDNFLRRMGELSGLRANDGRLDSSPNFYDPGALASRRMSAQTQPVRLPPIEIARRLYAAQYMYIGTIFAFTEPSTFDRLLRQAYRGTPDLQDRDNCLTYAKVLMILAFGQLYSVNQWIDFKGPPGFEYFTYALRLLPDTHEEGSVLYIETLALVGYFMQNMNRRDAAFLYVGMALRMAISLGLHQEVSGHDVPEATREHRRRVWWSIYSLDRILSVKSGNPLTIHDEDIGVSLPSPLPTEASYCPAVVLRHYTELSRILGEVNRCIYSKTGPTRSGSRMMTSVQSIILALSKWHRELPEELRFDPAKLSISRESVSTLLHYYQIINMTARPLLFHVIRKKLRDRNSKDEETTWKAGLSKTTVRVIEMCIDAAQDTTNMMTIAAQRDQVATYGYMDSEHVFSATTVLVMVCLAFPANEQNTGAMNAALRLLRGMASRGNSHMGERYQLLAHLRSRIDPLCMLMPLDAIDPLGGGAAGGLGTAWPPSPTVKDGHPLSSTATATAPSMRQQPQSHTVMTPSLSLGTEFQVVPDGSGSTELLFDDLSPDNVRGRATMNWPAADMPLFPLVGTTALDDMFYDVDMSTAMGDDDFGQWEEAFANPAGCDLAQWTTQTAELASGSVFMEW